MDHFPCVFIWVFPKIGVPPKQPKMIIFSRKTLMVVGETHHFRKHPYKHSMGVSKNRGKTPKWMAFLMEIPIKLDDLGGVFPTILGKPPI